MAKKKFRIFMNYRKLLEGGGARNEKIGAQVAQNRRKGRVMAVKDSVQKKR